MKILLNVSKPKGSSHILWEHLLKSAAAFIGTFAMLFFGPMMLGSRSRGGNSEDRLSYKMIEYIIEHPEVQIGLSALAVVIINIYIIIKNQKSRHISKVSYDENCIQIELINLYFTKKKEINIALSDFEFYIEKVVTDDNEKRQKIIFLDKRKNEIIGEINPKHLFWSDHIVQLKVMIQELEAYRTKSITAKKRILGLSTFTKWQ